MNYDNYTYIPHFLNTLTYVILNMSIKILFCHFDFVFNNFVLSRTSDLYYHHIISSPSTQKMHAYLQPCCNSFLFFCLNLYRPVLNTDAIDSVVRNVCFAITFWLLCDLTSINRVLNVTEVLCFDRVFIPITHSTRR